VRAVQVDERDASWEGPDPRFRVYLHGSGETETAGWTDTYDITGGDVLQVIDWAEASRRKVDLMRWLSSSRTRRNLPMSGRGWSGCSVWTATTWTQIRTSGPSNSGCCPGALTL
jgi:hypothetical protein